MVEHPFGVLKRQFGFTKVCYRGLTKSSVQIVTLFALSNLWMKLECVVDRLSRPLSSAPR